MGLVPRGSEGGGMGQGAARAEARAPLPQAPPSSFAVPLFKSMIWALGPGAYVLKVDNLGPSPGGLGTESIRLGPYAQGPTY